MASPKKTSTSVATKKRTPAKKSSVPGVTFIRELEGIQEYTLDSNDLQILLVQDDSVPVAGCMVTYHVGSRNEAIGYTGSTHLLEHLMFKGSTSFNKENSSTIWDLLETRGAQVNASTWFDRTNYYEVVSKEDLPTAIAIEADRMRNAFIREEDRQSEMTVVRNEFERGENNPLEALDKQIWAIAYQAHPYHHSTIGWRSDIENVSIERLKEFYDQFYWPDNATVTVAGNFVTTEALTLISEKFSVHPRAPHALPRMYTEEPPQEGERRVTVKRTGANMVAMGHKTPQASHEDIPALLLLDTILSNGKTSRLYKALVDTAKATSASTYCYMLHDPGLFLTYVTLTPKTTHEAAEKIMKKTYSDVQSKGVTAAELSQAKRAIRVYFASRRDGLYALLASINEDIAMGDWTQFVTIQDKLSKVTVRDIARVAQQYLIDDHSTVGWFVTTDK